MRKILISFIFVLIFSVAAFAQTNENSPCPKISISGPVGFLEPSEPIKFTALIDNVNEKLNLQYNWSVSEAKTFEGQGTLAIKVLERNFPSETVVVTLEIAGLPRNCPNTASASYLTIYDPLPTAVKVDEFSTPVSKIENRKSEKLIKALKDDLSAQLYVFVGYREKTLPKTQTEKEREILELLTKENGINANRITLVRIFSNEESVQFWVVPAGATIPDSEN